MLLACWLVGKGTTRQAAPGAVLIELVGGIHEIYFPFVLSRPVLLLPIIAGNVTCLTFYTLMDFGVVAPVAPGSIISLILMTPKGKTIVGILGVLIAAGVSLLLSIPLIKKNPDFQSKPVTLDSALAAAENPESKKK